MNLKNLIKIFKENYQLKRFLSTTESCDILMKKLSQQEISRINSEYPNFLKKKGFEKRNKITLSKEIEKISSLTLVKHDLSNENHVRIKKIKFYIDESTGKIIKILEN